MNLRTDRDWYECSAIVLFVARGACNLDKRGHAFAKDIEDLLGWITGRDWIDEEEIKEEARTFVKHISSIEGTRFCYDSLADFLHVLGGNVYTEIPLSFWKELVLKFQYMKAEFDATGQIIDPKTDLPKTHICSNCGENMVQVKDKGSKLGAHIADIVGVHPAYEGKDFWECPNCQNRIATSSD